MAVHELKTHPAAFQDVWEGRKPFEFRKDDRDPPFAIDDVLWLKEWNPDRSVYSGRWISCHASCIYRGLSPYGIPAGYCVIGLTGIQRYAPKHPGSTEMTWVGLWRVREFPAHWPDVAG